MSDVIKILMERDDVSREEAEEMIGEAREALNNGDYDAIEDYLGLEPDYIFDIL